MMNVLIRGGGDTHARGIWERPGGSGRNTASQGDRPQQKHVLTTVQQCGSVFRSPELSKTNFWDLSSQSMVSCYGPHRRLVCEFATFCHFQEEMSFALCFFCFRWPQIMQSAGYTNSFSSVIFMPLLKKFKNTHSFKDLNVWVFRTRKPSALIKSTPYFFPFKPSPPPFFPRVLPEILWAHLVLPVCAWA